MFPPEEIELILRITIYQLEEHSIKTTSIGEILKFFGIWILATRFEFGSRHALWSNTTSSKYIPGPSFVKTGMVCNRSDNLWQHIGFSDRKDTHSGEMSSEKFQWTSINHFVTNFNKHCVKIFIPGANVCVDETISKWYGLEGELINIGLPMYVAIDRKPDNGCKIQDVAHGRSKIMIRLKLVKTETEEAANSITEDGDGHLHSTNILLSLIFP